MGLGKVGVLFCGCHGLLSLVCCGLVRGSMRASRAYRWAIINPDAMVARNAMTPPSMRHRLMGLGLFRCDQSGAGRNRGMGDTSLAVEREGAEYVAQFCLCCLA